MLNLISVVTDPLLVISETGDIKHVNSAMLKLLRLSEDTLANKNVSRYVSDETFSTLINVGLPEARHQVFSALVELIDTQHETHRTEARIVSLGDNDDFPGCYALTLDRRPARRTVFNSHTAEVPHRVRVRGGGAGFTIRFGEDGTIREVDERTATLLGSVPEAFAGKVIWELAGWSDRANFVNEIQSCMRALRKSDKQYMPARFENERGEVVWLELCLTRDQNSSDFIVETFDVTSRVVTELSQRHYTSRLAELSRQLIRAQESERRRIAQELHDQIGQLLTALRLGLHSIKNSVDSSDVKGRIDLSMETVDRVLGHVRSLSLDLRPAMLDDLGLAAALNWFGSRHSELTGLRIEVFTDDLDRRLPNTVEVACFRIVQEAVTNALRHSQSEEVHISMRYRDDELHLAVEDFGVGFDTHEVLRGSYGKHKVGLENMQQRAALVGGSLTLDSVKGRGSRVLVRIPIR